MATLDQIIADAQTHIEAILSLLAGGATAGSLDAATIQMLQVQATGLAGDLTEAAPAVQQLLAQLAQCQQQPNPGPITPVTPTTPSTTQPMQVDAKAAALVALGALVIGGFGGYLIKGATTSGSGAKGSHKRHTGLREGGEASRRRLPAHNPKD